MGQSDVNQEVGHSVEVDILVGYPTQEFLLFLIEGTHQLLFEMETGLLTIYIAVDIDVGQPSVFVFTEAMIKRPGITFLGCHHLRQFGIPVRTLIERLDLAHLHDTTCGRVRPCATLEVVVALNLGVPYTEDTCYLPIGLILYQFQQVSVLPLRQKSLICFRRSNQQDWSWRLGFGIIAIASRYPIAIIEFGRNNNLNSSLAIEQALKALHFVQFLSK